jgi:DNA-binding response OmpR family regulator
MPDVADTLTFTTSATNRPFGGDDPVEYEAADHHRIGLRVNRTGQHGGMDSSPVPRPPTLRALVVDDEAPLAEVVASYLEREHFETAVAGNGTDAISIARELDPDVVILDLGLPGIDGLEVCRQLRMFSDAYVVMLTARDTEMDTVLGLTVGADDYVTKPFSPRELVARIRAMLRRPRAMPTADAAAGAPAPSARQFGVLRIDVAAREVTIEDEPILLTRTEFDLLATLSARPGVVLSRRQLLEAIRDEPWVGNDHLVDVHIGHLRRKLGDDAAAPRFIVTIRGVGYRMGAGL